MAVQRFYKGRTNNHLTWVMVDATDFATPESALSGATKIKVYGKLRSATGVNFVSSGTGSLTNDIQHVGASVLGIYTIALAKADLSDASAAWYDQYVVSLSATGAAYQTLVVEGVIDDSNLSGVLSDVYSALLVAQSAASDAASAAAQTNSRVLLVQSRLSDFDSRLVSDVSDIRSMLSDMMSDFQSRVPKRVATDSQLSDLHSDLRSFLVVMSGVQSDVYSALSDFQSDFGSRVPKRVATDSQLSDMASDLKSAIGAVTAVVSPSDISDIASAVWANTIGARVDSRILVAQSFLSDIRSHVSDLQSDFQSRVPKLVATSSQLSDLSSDVKSAVAAITVSLDASNISDIASAVVAALPITSMVSDIYSLLSDLQSDFQSRVPKRVATDSQLSDLHSDLKSHLTVSSGVQSDIYSLLSDLRSDFQSRVGGLVADLVWDAPVNDHLDALSFGSLEAITNNAALGLETTIGTPAGATIAADLVTIDNFLDTEIADILTDTSTTLDDMVDDLEGRLTAALATALQAHGLAIGRGVVDAASTTTAVIFKSVNGAAASGVNDFYNGRTIIFTSGALTLQATSISDYTGASKTATVPALTGAPAEDVTFVIV